MPGPDSTVYLTLPREGVVQEEALIGMPGYLSTDPGSALFFLGIFFFRKPALLLIDLLGYPSETRDESDEVDQA